MDNPLNDVVVLTGIASAADCQIACQQNSECIVFGFVANGGRCVLKNKENPVISSGVIAGPKFCKEKRSNL